MKRTYEESENFECYGNSSEQLISYEFQAKQCPSGEPLVIRRTLQPGGMGLAASLAPGFEVEGLMAMGGFMGDGQNDAPSGSAADSTGDA
ncbi:hypothetical protein DCAR_0207128 [Daucus carota subsp. sativus]|uniref:Uncharacterized protein n=1 Tax=Daucus carota subsp. sativus TaxID=79200 RepID=A0A166DNS0_DAUCS|nr:hypothetical protein DCAR_0207128 [Daucus carota subsp. sativus]